MKKQTKIKDGVKYITTVIDRPKRNGDMLLGIEGECGMGKPNKLLEVHEYKYSDRKTLKNSK